MRTYIYKNKETGKIFGQNEMREYMRSHDGEGWETYFIRIYFNV